LFASAGVNSFFGGTGNDTMGLFSSQKTAGSVFDGGADLDRLTIVKLNGVSTVDLRDDTVTEIEALLFF